MAHQSRYSRDELKQSAGVRLYSHAKTLIPGGTQLLSKRPEMFAPESWPSYYSRAKGCTVWDLEGREFLDMSIMSVGACILGYADDDVDDAVVGAIRQGVGSSLNCPEEVQLAEVLLELHPWFGMARFARSGGEAMGLAIRIARAHTKRDLVLFSGYHGWNDWYLAANLSNELALDGQLMPGLEPAGVPRGLTGTALPFLANDIESVRQMVRGRENQVAAIVIEPARGEDAPPGYLKALRELAGEIEAILIFDEITSGFRMCVGGIHRNYRVNPDMAVFAKSMANGYAISAVLGAQQIMESAQKTFISSTNWTDRVGPVAALATIKKYQEKNTSQHIVNTGNAVKNIWKKAAIEHGLNLSISGLPSLAAFAFKGEHSERLNTQFTVEMLTEGILGFRQFKAALAHNTGAVEKYAAAVGRVFHKLADDPTCQKLDTPVHHSGFRRLTAE